MEGESIDLPKSEVKERLKYKDQAITDELHGFGRMLLNDAVERMGKLDSKAATLAGYCGAVITLLLATAKGWQSTSSVAIIAMAATIVFLSGACAISSMALQKTEWFSQEDWLRKECLTSADALKRYYILATWRIVDSHHAAYRRKIWRIYAAQLLLALAGVILFLALLNAAAPSTFQYLWAWVR
jgi:hypothetical protein